MKREISIQKTERVDSQLCSDGLETRIFVPDRDTNSQGGHWFTVAVVV